MHSYKHENIYGTKVIQICHIWWGKANVHYAWSVVILSQISYCICFKSNVFYMFFNVFNFQGWRNGYSEDWREMPQVTYSSRYSLQLTSVFPNALLLKLHGAEPQKKFWSYSSLTKYSLKKKKYLVLT